MLTDLCSTHWEEFWSDLLENQKPYNKQHCMNWLFFQNSGDTTTSTSFEILQGKYKQNNALT